MDLAEKKSEEIVSRYVQALKTLDIEPIAFYLHQDFAFLYPLAGHGGAVRANLRYIGYLYLTFQLMRKEGRSIKAELCFVTNENKVYPSILLQPPHDRRIIYPIEDRYITSVHNYLPTKEVLLFTRVKQDLLFRVNCIINPDTFENKINK